MNPENTKELAENILSGKLDDRQIADALIQLAERGESPEEIDSFIGVLSSHMIPIHSDKDLLDICGTGGSGRDRFNVSTAAAFIVSALDVAVSKHGNRGSAKPNGSFDLLEALGIDFNLESREIEETIEKENLGFIFARKYHPIMKQVGPARKLAARRTIFNLAGPLCNPSKIKYQVIGTADRSKMEVLAKTCADIGRARAVVVYGEPGIDELSIFGTSHVIEYKEGAFTETAYEPEDFGIEKIPYEKLPCGDIEVNARIFRELMDNRCEKPVKDFVALNAGLALYCVSKAATIKEGYQLALQCIESGKMKTKYEAYCKIVEEITGRRS